MAKRTVKKKPSLEQDAPEMPNFLKWIMRIAFALILGTAILNGCSYLNQKAGVKDDHVLEEIIEAQIEKELGIDIDLTPSTPEL